MITILSRDAVFSRMLEISLRDLRDLRDLGEINIVSALPAVRKGIFICDTDSIGFPSREDIESFDTCILTSRQLEDGEYMGARVFHRPFPAELLREAVLYSGTPADTDTGRDLITDPDRLSVSLSGTEIILTPLEFSLFDLLLKRGDEGVTLEECSALFSEQGSNVIQVYVHYLRKKLDGLPGAPRIKTLRGRGYALVGERNRN